MKNIIKFTAQNIYNELEESDWGTHKEYDLDMYARSHALLTPEQRKQVVEQVLTLMEESRKDWENLPETSLTKELNNLFTFFEVDGFFETPNKVYMYCCKEGVQEHKEFDGLHQILECMKAIIDIGNYQVTNIDIHLMKYGGYEANISLKQL